MGPFNVIFLPIIFVFENPCVSLELLVQASQATFLQGDQIVNVDQMIAQGHLVLFLGFVQVTIEHLQDGIFGIDLSIVVLLVNLNDLLELFSFGQAQHLSPMVENLHAIQVRQLLLLDHLRLEVVPPYFHHLLFFVHVFGLNVCHANSNHRQTFVLFGGGLSLRVLSKLNHFVSVYILLVVDIWGAYLVLSGE